MNRISRPLRALRLLPVALLVAMVISLLALADGPIASSSFVGAEDPLSENGTWAPVMAYSPYGTLFQKNNGALADRLSPLNHAASRTTAVVPSDHYSEIVVGHIANARNNVGPIARVQASGATTDSCYLWWASIASGANYLYRLDSNVPDSTRGTTYTATNLIPTSPVVDGDRLRLIVRGPVIYGLKNGVRDFIYNTGADPTNYSNGTSGIMTYADGAVNNAVIASWSTGPAPASSGTWASSSFTGTENPLDEGDRWYPLPRYHGFTKAGGQVSGLDSNHNASAVWSITPPATQYSEVTLASVASGGGGPIVRIDRNNPGQTGWLLFLYADNPSSSGIYKMTPDGDFSGVQFFTPTIVAGDKWRLTATGNTLNVYRNGVIQITYTTDGSYATGDVGMEAFTPAFTYSGWQGGDTTGQTAPAPTVSSVSPGTGSTAGGTTVTITGTNFGAGATVSVGGGTATGVTVVNSTTITASTPAHAAGTVSITVTNTDGQSGAITAGFTYVLPAPSVTSVTPVSGPTTGGTAITITGTNFVAGATVTLGGNAATAVTIVSSTKITATTPVGAAGAVSVKVTNTDGQIATLANAFTYSVPNPAPTVSSVSPTAGPTNGGTALTITGANFIVGATVTLGSNAATAVAVVSSTTITATTPAGAAGAVSVKVTNSDGQSATLANGFTYIAPAPTVTSVSPNTGSTSGGAAVTITGTNFATGATVAFGANAATAVTVVSSTGITATTPAGSAGAVGVKVTNSDGQSATLASGFTYAASIPAPTVSSVSPNTGLASGGTLVTITGTNFVSGATVTLGSTSATAVTVVNSTTITATTPAGAAGAVGVKVTNSDGQSATLANGFTYTASNPPPTISSSNFAGAEDPLSENGAWAPVMAYSPYGTLFLKNNGALADRLSPLNHAASRTTAAVPADQYSEIVVGHIGSTRNNVGPMARVQTSGAATDSTYLWWTSIAGGASYLYRLDSNVPDTGRGTSYTATNLIPTSPVVDGDKLRLIVRGSVVYGLKNGVRDFIYNTGTNPTKYSTGATGIMAYADGAVTNAMIASWSTGPAPASSGTWASSTFIGAENPLDEGDSWYPLPGYSGFSKAGGQAIGLDSNHNASGVWSIAPPANQYSEVTLGSVASGGGGPIVRIDRSNPGQTGWLLFLYAGNPGSSGIYKMTPDANFSAVQLFTPTLVAGDKWRLTAIGNTLSVYRNGALQFTYTTDGSYAAGDVGIEAFTPSFTFSAWQGGDTTGH
ncbi:MAG TPA: IPT/TIG domain-containing protein [Verrucomicrobiae bacterium]|nr:IPT/TIG domain-containing protein [Verrucomicrobiae bacterium]